MTNLVFESEWTYPSDYEIRIPIAVMSRSGEPKPFDAVLDTGATMSIFNNALLQGAGIEDIANGEARSIVLADGRRILGFVHDLQVAIIGIEVTIPVFFSPELPADIDNLLGIFGVLEQLDIAILHRERRLFVRS